MIRHDIKIDLLSNFTYIDSRITITKHEVVGTRGLKPFFDETEIKSAYCRSCNINVEFSEALYRCDNCGNNIVKADVENVGDTIIVCPRCIKGIENFEVFKIFGQRGPSQQARNRRVEEAVNSAVEAMPELPSDILEMLSGQETNFNVQSSTVVADIAEQEARVSEWTTFNPTTSSTSGGTDNA